MYPVQVFMPRHLAPDSCCMEDSFSLGNHYNLGVDTTPYRRGVSLCTILQWGCYNSSRI